MTPFARAVELELARARVVHPEPVATPHDGYGKLMEEVHEYFLEIMEREPVMSRPQMLQELVQVAVVAQRTAEDLGLVERGLECS